jgi:Carboxypeptidase regulatory-like domain
MTTARLLLTVAFLPTLGVVSAAENYVVGGVVVDSQSHAPLANVRVSLAPTDARDQKLEQITKQDGRFSFSVKEPGKYALQVLKPGYPVQSYKQAGLAGVSSAIVVRDDRDTRNIVFEAIRGGAITGQIKDEDSEPVGNALVEIFQLRVVGGERKVVTRQQVRANGLGEFRMARLASGNYYVCAMGRPWFADSVIQMQRMQEAFGKAVQNASIARAQNAVQPDPDDDQPLLPMPAPEYSADTSLRGTAFVTTFYPNAPTVEEAGLVRVEAGAETQVSITLPLAKAVSVKGKISVPGDMSDGRANLTKKISGQFMSFLQAWVAKDGSFEFPNVPPGAYEIAAASQSSSGASSWSIRQEIEVGGSDLEVTLRPQSMGSVSGHLVFESERPKSSGSLFVSLRNDRNNAYSAEVNPEGNFAIRRLPAGKYEALLGGSKDYIAAYFTGAAGERWPLSFEVSSGEAVRRDLVLTKAVSVIDGTVEQAGVPQVGAFVLLMPKNPAERWAYRVDQTDTDGSYRLTRIPTGDYFLIALSTGEDIAYRDAKVAAILAGAAKQIHVEPRDKLDMKLEVVAGLKISGT